MRTNHFCWLRILITWIRQWHWLICITLIWFLFLFYNTLNSWGTFACTIVLVGSKLAHIQSKEKKSKMIYIKVSQYYHGLPSIIINHNSFNILQVQIEHPLIPYSCLWLFFQQHFMLSSVSFLEPLLTAIAWQRRLCVNQSCLNIQWLMDVPCVIVPGTKVSAQTGFGVWEREGCCYLYVSCPVGLRLMCTNICSVSWMGRIDEQTCAH